MSYKYIVGFTFLVLSFLLSEVKAMDVELLGSKNVSTPSSKQVRFAAAVRKDRKVVRRKRSGVRRNPIGILSSDSDHLNFFENRMNKAKQSVVIVSSQISRAYLQKHFFPMLKKLENELDVTIYTTKFGKDNLYKAHLTQAQLVPSLPKGLTVLVCGKFPSEILLVDYNWYAQGNFPWLRGRQKGQFYSTYMHCNEVAQIFGECKLNLDLAVITANREMSLKESIVPELKSVKEEKLVQKSQYDSSRDLEKLKELYLSENQNTEG